MNSAGQVEIEASNKFCVCQVKFERSIGVETKIVPYVSHAKLLTWITLLNLKKEYEVDFRASMMGLTTQGYLQKERSYYH